MGDRILIFSDHRGSEGFFLRFDERAGEFPIWFERWANLTKRDTDWAAITLEDCG